MVSRLDSRSSKRSKRINLSPSLWRTVMKIAVSATGPSLDADVDPRFGRCRYLVIVDPETMEFEVVENPNVGAAGGAGTATAQMVANMGVEVVLTGNPGPNASQTLDAAGIKVATGMGRTVRSAVDGYKTGSVRVSSLPTPGTGFGAGGMGMRGSGGGAGQRTRVRRGQGPRRAASG